MQGSLSVFASGYLQGQNRVMFRMSLEGFTQLIGGDWVWCFLVPEVSHWLPLVAGVGEGGEAHTAEHDGDGEVAS